MDLHHRHSIRVAGFDYSKTGAYFFTLLAHQKACLFGDIFDGRMSCSQLGRIAEQELYRLGQRLRNVNLDAFVLMPNHIHAILILGDNNASQSRSSIALFNTRDYPHGPASGSIGAIIGQFKSRVTKRVWKLREWTGVPIWQRNYYEHIIRDQDDYNRIRVYIESNPLQWEDDNP